MRNKATLSSIDNSNPADYPNGRIKDNTGAGNGTPVNEFVYGDLQEFIYKLMRLAGEEFNNLPDNETNGYQTIKALQHLPSKNDKILTISETGGRLAIPLKLSKLEENESFICYCSVGLSDPAETEIIGTLGDTSTKVINVTGSFLVSEYVMLVNKTSSIDIIRLVDFNNINTVVAALNFLKAATQAQEDEGTDNNVATTPLRNKTTFSKRVIGIDSADFLATALRNGLYPKEHFAIVAGLGSSSSKYGTVAVGNVGGGSIGQTFVRTGNIQSATLVQKFSNSSVIQIVLDSAMTSSNFEVISSIQSLGDIDFDNDFTGIAWKRIDNSTIQIHLQKLGNVTQNVKLHVTINQR